jgi:ligand-binding sensor domain-containing protein/serine phosphatase RsbU (regulator of sigma subunit)
MVQSAASFSAIKRLFVFFLTLLISTAGFAQLERFKSFDPGEGEYHPFVYTINQDKNGFIWFGTGEGLYRFDGSFFESFATIDSLSNDVVSVSYKDSLGDLWFGFSNGLLLSWDGVDFKKYVLPGENTTGITSITQSPWGEIFVSTLNKGCYLISSEGNVRLADEGFQGRLIYAAHFTDSTLMLGTSDGLEIIPLSDQNFLFKQALIPEQLAYLGIQVIKKSGFENIYFAGTEDAGLFKIKILSNSVEISKIGASSILDYQNVQDVLHTSNNNLWVCTYYAGLIKLTGFNSDGTFEHLTNYKKGKGFNTNYFKSLFFDREENIWVGTYGDGLALLAEQSFAFLNFEQKLSDDNILAVESNDSLLWLGAENGLLELSLRDIENQKFYRSGTELPDDKITTICYLNNKVWVGTESNGVFVLEDGANRFTPFFRSNNSLGNSINYLQADGNFLYAATKDGIYIFDLETDETYHYNTEAGLPHNDIEHILVDAENRLLFATRSNGIFEIDERGDVVEYFTVGNYELAFNSIAQDIHGQTWVSTFGQGIFLLLPDTVINFTFREGLKSNYCYSVATADSQYVWVGHRLGLSRIHIDDFSIKTFDINFGITGDANQNAVAVDSRGKLFFGTTDGLIIYDGEKAKAKSVPPKTNLVNLFINDNKVSFTEPIVLPYAPYKLRIEYVGLNYNDPEAVLYQYKLQGYDLDWSELTELNYTIYSRIEDGDYTFQIRSFGHDGSYDTSPVGFSLKVKPPFWKTWWFISLAIIIGLLVIVFIVKYREKRQKEIQEYLEKRLDERTREVVEQKEEIEIKNRDITDSINYAQRIQTSILPPIKKLQQSFSGSFIFYQPRDIVSGDFYWFDKITDDKFIIVCADSTGHGVPGAFMSMIGTTLIKDICISQKASSPSKILQELDAQLSNTLNQNVDAAQSNDGMDAMVCELDVNTYELRYASAMRPMIIYKNGEQMYVKGSRSSIGGQYDTKDEKDFYDEVIQLNKGDLVYLFSDGYPDQFGGPLGKKFKMVRLKNLLKDIQKKPMEEQYEYVKSTFNLWKEDYEQVDDVLFMGIKL